MRRFLPFLILLLALGARAQTPLEASGLATFRNWAAATFPSAATIQDFHAETAGTQYSYIPSASAYGNTSGWTTNTDTSFDLALWNIVTGPDITYETPVTAGGTTKTSTGTKWLKGDLSKSSAGRIIYTDPDGALRVSASDIFCITNLSAIDQNSRDWVEFVQNPPVIAQMNVYDFQTGGTKLQGGLHSPAANGFTSSIITNLPENTYISREIWRDMQYGVGFIQYKNAFTHQLIFSVIGYNTPDLTLTTTYWALDGYIHTPTITGDNLRNGIRIINDPSTNRPPYVPNVPTSVSGSQVGSSIVVTWTDSNFMLNSNRVSVSNAADGELVGWSLPGTNTVAIGGATGGTYDVRASAYFLNDVHSSVASGGQVVFSPAVWYESIAAASLDSSVDQNATYINYSVDVTVTTSGTCSALRVNVATLVFGTTPIKLALFDNSGNLIAWTSGLTGATPGTLVYSISPVSVSPGTYKIAAAMDANGGANFFGSKSGTTGTQGRYSKGTAYSGFPDSTITGDGTEATHETMSMGMLVQ